MIGTMSYPFQTPGDEDSHGRTSQAFRLTAAILAAAAVLLFCMVGTEAGLASFIPWVSALVAAGLAFRFAPVLIAVIMVVAAPALVIAVLVRWFVT